MNDSSALPPVGEALQAASDALATATAAAAAQNTPAAEDGPAAAGATAEPSPLPPAASQPDEPSILPGPIVAVLALKGSSQEKVPAAISIALDGLDSAIAAFMRPLIARAPIPKDPEILDQVLDNAAALIASLKSDQEVPAA